MKLRLLILLSVILYSCGIKQESVSRKVFKVQTFTVQTDSSLKVLSFPGTVKASEDVNLSFKVSGTINKITVKEGDRISKGHFIASIDPKDYNIQLSAAEAQYKQIKAEAERVMRLYKDSVVSENNYDKARYGMEQITAKLNFAKSQVEDCKLYAPFDGYVQRIYFDPSSVVSAGMPVISFISSSVPEIEIDVPSYVYLNSKRVTDCYADFSRELGKKSVKLSLASFSPKANSNQLYKVRLSITSKLDKMPNPGMIAMVSLLFESSSDLEKTSIPVNSIYEEGNESYVWIISDDNTIHKHQVHVSMIDKNGMAQIEGVIKSGTRIVSAGVHKLTEGQKVDILEPVSETNVGGIL